MCFTSLKSTSVYALCSAAHAPLNAQFLLLRYALQHMRVLQFNSAASAAITRRAAARQEWHLLRPALLCPSKLLASALNRKTGQRPRPATQLYAPACCVYCGSLLQLQGGAGLRGKCGECCRVKSPCGGSSGAPACQTIASLHTSSTPHPLRITLSTAPLRAAAKQSIKVESGLPLQPQARFAARFRGRERAQLFRARLL